MASDSSATPGSSSTTPAPPPPSGHSAGVGLTLAPAEVTPGHLHDVVVVGAGLAGSLLAVYLARRLPPTTTIGVYEFRRDYRALAATGEAPRGRSINLALSARGLQALRGGGLDAELHREGLPMVGRLMHPRDTTQAAYFQPYGQQGQAIMSVGRQSLNEALLTAAERYPNVRLHFEMRCRGVDFRNNTLQMQRGGDGSHVTVQARQVILGADGANSAVRTAMQKQHGFDFAQEYLDHGYKELCIPPLPDGSWALRNDVLHIWPRGDFMLIALPNPDRSFTCTLFQTHTGPHGFDALQTRPAVEAFMREQFGDAAALMPTLLDDWFGNPVGHLVTIRCRPFHYRNRALILGDAAHALVPFFGQGMNASFQDVYDLDQLLQRFDNDWSRVLPAFTAQKKPDADAVSALSYHNYHVMRSAVMSSSFLIRNKLELLLNRLFPTRYQPLYSMVSFGTLPYHEVVQRAAANNRLLSRILYATTGLALATGLGIAAGIGYYLRRR